MLRSPNIASFLFYSITSLWAFNQPEVWVEFRRAQRGVQDCRSERKVMKAEKNRGGGEGLKNGEGEEEEEKATFQDGEKYAASARRQAFP